MAWIRIGDVFTVPIDEALVGFGLIGARVGEFLELVIFRGARPTVAPFVETIVEDDIALVALTFDTKLATGAWKVVGHVRLEGTLRYPLFREGTSPGTFEVAEMPQSWSRADRRDFRRRRHRFVRPDRVEAAVRALHGRGEWSADYSELLAPGISGR